jgi:hypothetical protein
MVAALRGVVAVPPLLATPPLLLVELLVADRVVLLAVLRVVIFLGSLSIV